MADTSPYPRKTVNAIIAALSGSIAGAVITLSIGGGTVITKHVRTAAVINVNSMAAGQSTSSRITLTGAAVGDTCLVAVTVGDYLSTTSTGRVGCKILVAATADLFFSNATPTAAFDAGASTFSVQNWAYTP